MIRVGGDFWYSPGDRGLTDLLLIGGGVGINPLFSMLSHHVRLQSRPNSESAAGRAGAVTMLYSSKTENELLFKVCPPSLPPVSVNSVESFIVSGQNRAACLRSRQGQSSVLCYGKWRQL